MQVGSMNCPRTTALTTASHLSPYEPMLTDSTQFFSPVKGGVVEYTPGFYVLFPSMCTVLLSQNTC